MPWASPIRVAALLLPLLFLTGCTVKKTSPPPDQPIPGIDVPVPLDPIDALLLDGALPDPSDPASMEPRFAPLMTLTARYRIEPTAGGKKLQTVLLVGEDGRLYVRAYRPMPSEYQYADKRVVVAGRPYVNSPYVQSVGGLHFEVQSMALAEGEVARDPIPTQIPAPPLARTADVAAAEDGWYAICVGSAADGRFTFVDGGSMGIEKAMGNLPDLTGADITMLAAVHGGSLRPMHVCEGVVPRCGIDDVQ